MATDCTIWFEKDLGGDEKLYDGIVCQWEGYPEGVGKDLKLYYTDPGRVAYLINLGNIAFLGKFMTKEEAGVQDCVTPNDYLINHITYLTHILRLQSL